MLLFFFLDEQFLCSSKCWSKLYFHSLLTLTQFVFWTICTFVADSLAQKKNKFIWFHLASFCIFSLLIFSAVSLPLLSFVLPLFSWFAFFFAETMEYPIVVYKKIGYIWYRENCLSTSKERKLQNSLSAQYIYVTVL